MTEKWAVVVVDMQGDFTEWKQGSLSVPGSDEGYVKSVEAATRQLKERGALILGTQDWHPPDHVSFSTSHQGKKPLETIMIAGEAQVLWPPHCIQGTENARVLVDNNLFLVIVKKSQDSAMESYSGFEDRKGTKTEIDTILQINGVKKVIVFGIATDYCVRATALGLSAANYETTVIEGLCRGVSPKTTSAALDEMRRNGVKVIKALDEIIEKIGQTLF